MGGATRGDMMDSAREIIMFPQQTPAYSPGSNDIYTDYPSQLGSPLGINTGPSQGASGRPSSLDSFPLSGGPSNGGAGVRPFGEAGGPSRGSGRPFGGAGVPDGGNSGTVYVNNLGQLSTDRDSISFDPKASYFLKPEKDSKVDEDSYDPIKGIENSYSFGFPDASGLPIRGSADLSEPVEPSSFPIGDEYLPPHLNGQNQKQLFTYPHDEISPEYTGQINTELAAQSPKYEAPGVYGPAVSPQSALNGFQQPSQSAPQNRYQQSQKPSQQRPQQPSNLYQQPSAPSNLYQKPQQPSNLYQQPSAPSNLYQKPQQSQSPAYQQPSSSPNFNQQPSGLYQQPTSSFQQPSFQQPSSSFQQPSSSFQQPSSSFQQQQRPSVPSGLYQQPQNFQQQGQPSSYNQPQPFRPQNQQSERRQFNVPQGSQNSFSNGNGQSNQEYLRNVLKDKTHVHEDKQQLGELIQRFFVKPPSQERVVSTEVFPSPAKESFSFTYGDEGASSNSNGNYQPPSSGKHQHTGNGGHQGYHY